MHSRLRYVAVGIMVTVPAGAAVLLAILPGEVDRVPAALCLLWAFCSLVVSLEAPRLADWLNGGIHTALRTTRLFLALGCINLIFSGAILLHLLFFRE